MTQTQFAGENEAHQVSGARTVVIGVKLGPQSRELLTWALVKVADPGDRLIALHVLSNEIVDKEGKSSLLSLVKAFDSVLAVYQGFCNLKQVDLKLKICRGSSVRKILVQEAKSYSATDVIVGTSRNHHTVRSMAAVAKYCAKKLPKDCAVVAVNNGKILFHREPSEGTEDHKRNGLLHVIQRTLTKNSKVLNDSSANTCENLMLAIVKANSEYKNSADERSCSICSPESLSAENNPTRPEGSSGESEGDNSMAIVPLEASSSSISLLIRESPELRHGWPLIRRAILTNRLSVDGSSVSKVSVVQWAMQPPSRSCGQIMDLEEKGSVCESDEEAAQSSQSNGEEGVIVVGDDEIGSIPSSPHCDSCSLPVELEGLHEKYAVTCRLFKYKELLLATSNFKPENLIGKGGSSQVYRGCLPDGKELAVKILKPSEDVLKEFVLEIEIITTLHHKNIISLFGFCFEDNNLLLVYDFLSRGSLEENLNGNKKDEVAFTWSDRYKVAVGVAEALDYLHNKSAQPVIHRDVKSSNILLSDDFEPQLSDFGLAKWASTTSSHITCADVSGTFGYLAPEYFMYGKVNNKIDVYAFGVVLLELLSGRKPISNEYPKGQESLVMWAKPILNNGKFAQLLDSSLCGNYDHEEMERMVLAAALCIRRSPRARPHMSLVLKILKGDVEIIKWAGLEVNAPKGSYAKIEVNPLDGPDALEDEEGFSPTNLESHLKLALRDVDSSSLSMSSIEQSMSFEDYLRSRWSRSSSFD